jgi:hypothetical protein
MRAGRAIVAVVFIGAALTAIAGAAAGGSATALDLQSRGAIDSYLRSLGVDPTTVVRQSGRLNYAGPRCPGAAWNCTSSTRVVQITAAGGRNDADCTHAAEACIVVQTGNHNKAECKQRTTAEPTATLKCSITQQGKKNSAEVHQVIDQRHGPIQDAREIAEVRQQAKDRNELELVQLTTQGTSKGAEQEQDGHTTADVVQTAGHGGKNVAELRQAQELSASGSASRQLQNTKTLPDKIADCATETNPFGFSPTQPNVCADVEQHADGGENENELEQTIREHASTTVSASATQQQGLAKSLGSGGIDGEVDQESGSGSSQNDADQDHHQQASGPSGVRQAQWIDPGCCGVTQRSVKSFEEIEQSAIQSASSSNAFQSSRTVGVSHTPGACRIEHRARNNSDSHEAAVSEPGPCAVVLITVCRSGDDHAAPRHDKDHARGKCESERRGLPSGSG